MKLKITSKDQIPGFTKTDQHAAYHKVANKLPPGANILEVGCGYGLSTWAWLDAIPENTNFYVVDNFTMGSPLNSKFVGTIKHNRFSRNKFLIQHQTIMENNRKYLKKYFSGNQKDIFTRVIAQHPKADLLKNIYEEDFEVWKLSNSVKFDLVYLDGDHSEEAVSNQLEYFKDSKIICGDDLSWSSVTNAVTKFAEKYNFTLQALTQDFFVIET